jgi:hypothetical protein
MNCVILQPSYIPWRGYFDQIQKADVFIFYDDAQYDKHGWRNRNRIKTPHGVRWLTIPVTAKGNVVQSRRIMDIEICHDTAWNRRHLDVLKQAYERAPYFGLYIELLERMYFEPPALLADFTIQSTIQLARQLGITRTKFIRASELQANGTRTDRLVDLLSKVGATHYISGPSAREYLEEDKLRQAGVTLEYMIYNYDPYEQLYPPYEPKVSILDFLFMQGPSACSGIWRQCDELKP